MTDSHTDLLAASARCPRPSLSRTPTDVSAWSTTSAQAGCRECNWSRVAFSANQVMMWARSHAAETGHEVDLQRKLWALVTPQVEEPNPHVQKTWAPEGGA